MRKSSRKKCKAHTYGSNTNVFENTVGLKTWKKNSDCKGRRKKNRKLKKWRKKTEE